VKRPTAKGAGLLLVVAVSVSCAASAWDSSNEVMQSWMGKSAGDLIASWGPPTATSTDGRGGAVLTYYRNEHNLDCCYQQLYANANGIIYFWRRVDGWSTLHTPTKP
jgi:hypothetical protein